MLLLIMVAITFILAGVFTGIDPALLSSICAVESGHKPYKVHYNDGNANSYGICQIKLETARELGFKGTVQNLMDPLTNAIYAGLYLAKQKKRYGTWKLAISGYNCGHACKNLGYIAKVRRTYVRTKGTAEMLLWRKSRIKEVQDF